MIRKKFPMRPGWVERCNSVGFDYCNLPSSDGSWYWSEGVAYELTLRQVDYLEDSTNELHEMCMDLVNKIVASGDYPKGYRFTDQAKTLIQQSGARADPSLYGRFDFAYDGETAKLLEYNADTPTGLLESSVVQWHWVEEADGVPNRDQFNSIHEKLIERWKYLVRHYNAGRVHFTASEVAEREDWGNVEYLMSTAVQAGVKHCAELTIDDIGWSPPNFVDTRDTPIQLLFKLYPWEWMAKEAFAEFIGKSPTRIVEPAWKMLLSNKMILPLLWDAHRGHPLLLPAFLETATDRVPMHGKWARKPTLSREGANISICENGRAEEIKASSRWNPMYDHSGYILQAWVDLPYEAGFYRTVGSWVVGDQAAGICIREDFSPVTGNDAHFVPHYFVEP